MTYGLFGRLDAVPGSEDQLIAHLLEAAELLRDNADCIAYVVASSGDPAAVYVFEVWTSQDAHDASLSAPEVGELIQRARPLIAGMSEPTQVRVHGGKGLPS